MSPGSDRENKPQSFDLNDHETVEELRALPDAELERRHDAVVQALSDSSMDDQKRQLRIGRAHAYRAVLEHRQRARQAERMEGLTRSMNRLTWPYLGRRPSHDRGGGHDRVGLALRRLSTLLDSSRVKTPPTSENSVQKLSEKGRRRPRHSPWTTKERAFRLILAPLHPQIHRWSSAHTPFQTVSRRSSRNTPCRYYPGIRNGGAESMPALFASGSLPATRSANAKINSAM
jgi:hypothetical protein